jgi:threonine dehydrogenase-like Zn-dependent dehydrogenase
MWISTLYLEPKRVFLTKLFGLFYPDIYYSSFSPLQVQNLPRQPLPSASWVRVRNRLAGICGSDLHLIFADADPRIAPAALPGHPYTYPGHEVVGEVVEIGNEVQHLQVGDRVVLQNAPNCISTGIYAPCRSCKAGNYNLCEQGVLPGPQPIGGGWSEEMLVHEQQLFRLPKQLSDEQGVLLEPTAVAAHAVLRHLPQPGDKVLIIGAGTIGLLTLQVIRALVPEAKVSVLARYAPQRELAKRMGATYLIHPTDSYGEMQQVTGAQLYRGIFGNRTLLGGYDVIYDTVGQRNSLYHALRWACSQASIVLVGANLHMMHIDLTPIWHQQINLLGATSHGMETWPPQSQQRISTFSLAAELMLQDRIHPEELITHRFALNSYKDALITATRKARSHAIKVIFDYSLQPASAVPNSKAIARTPLPLSTNTLPKPVNTLAHDHAKDELRQLRLSQGLSTTTSKEQLATSEESQSTIKTLQRSQTSDIPEEEPSTALNAAVISADQDEQDTSSALQAVIVPSNRNKQQDTSSTPQDAVRSIDQDEQGPSSALKSTVVSVNPDEQGPSSAPEVAADQHEQQGPSSAPEAAPDQHEQQGPSSTPEAVADQHEQQEPSSAPEAAPDQTSLTVAEPLCQIEPSHQTATETTQTQEPVVQDQPAVVVESTTISIQEEQVPQTDKTPTSTVSSEEPVSQSETAQPPMDVLLETPLPLPEEDTQPTIEMAQLRSPEEGPSSENESTSPEQAEKTNEATSDKNGPSFPEIEETPTVRIRPKRGSRKRKTKPFVKS